MWLSERNYCSCGSRLESSLTKGNRMSITTSKEGAWPLVMKFMGAFARPGTTPLQPAPRTSQKLPLAASLKPLQPGFKKQKGRLKMDSMRSNLG